MIVTTWNVRGFNSDKERAVRSLIREADVLCLTETRTEVPSTPDWRCVNCNPTDDQGRIKRHHGVALLYRPAIPLRRATTYSNIHFQCISGTLRGIPILACYVRPTIPSEEFAQFLQIAKNCLRGPGILVGDLNARHKAWDDYTNRHGKMLHNWAQSQKFLTQRPPRPTCITGVGQSRVDIIMHRSQQPPAITTLPGSRHSDHCPVRAVLSTCEAHDYKPVPFSLLTNAALCDRARDRYKKEFPGIIKALEECSTPASLTINSRRLAHATLAPWLDVQRPRPPRFRPGWTLALDKKSKKRSRLLRSKDPSDKAKARQLDREIKHTFRRNVRRLKSRLADEMANENPQTQSSVIKRALALNGVRDVAPVKVDPDAYTSFMESLQPNPNTPQVQMQTFTLPVSFRASLLKAIVSLKPKKSPGPDMIRPDILKLEPSLFADAIYALWAAVGRLASVPPILRSTTISPIYKGSGDPSQPTNNRPVSLTTAFRRAIASAINDSLQREYTPLREQWGFITGTNTECAIAFAVSQLRHKLPRAALLDIKKAYDMVPRDILQRLADDKLPPELSIMIRPLLAPMRLQTKGQRSTHSVCTLAGVPQGCPPSPTLFNIFMDTYIKHMNTAPDRSLVTLFADDVKLLARTLANMQTALDMSTSWADEHGMEWSVQKSCIIGLRTSMKLNGQQLQQKEEDIYLGVSMGPRGVTDTKLLQRLHAATNMLATLRRVTRTWKTTLRQRRALVKTYVLSIVDYLLYLQPMTSAVKHKAEQLENQCLTYVLATRVRQHQQKRASFLARLAPIQTRRNCHLISAVQKFYSRSISARASNRDKMNWQIMKSYGTIAPFVKSCNLPDEGDALPDWKRNQVSKAMQGAWENTNNFVRKIPSGKSIPPVFREKIGHHLEKKAVYWYMNKIPYSSALSIAKPHLAKILEKPHLSENDIAEVSNHLSTL